MYCFEHLSVILTLTGDKIAALQKSIDSYEDRCKSLEKELKELKLAHQNEAESSKHHAIILSTKAHREAELSGKYNHIHHCSHFTDIIKSLTEQLKKAKDDKFSVETQLQTFQAEDLKNKAREPPIHSLNR